MNRQLIIPLLLVIYLLCSARSCSDSGSVESRERHEINLIRDSIREAAETDYLDHDAIRAVEMTAVQKIADVADYLNIVNDTSARMVFREKAAGMIYAAFISKDSKVNLDPGSNTSPASLSKWLEQGLSDRYPELSVKADSAWISVPFSRMNDTLYSGQLKLRRLSASQLHPDAAEKITEQTVDAYCVRVKKVFGTDTIQTWVVMFGEIK